MSRRRARRAVLGRRDPVHLAALRDQLVAARLAGHVQTSRQDTLTKCARLIAGDDTVTFGLSDWRDATFSEVVAAVTALCGGDLHAAGNKRPGQNRPAAGDLHSGQELPAAGDLHAAGGDPDRDDAPGWIDPEATLAGVARHRERLAGVAAAGGARVLVATGHPAGLLPHYQAVARSLQSSGSQLLTPAEGRPLPGGEGGRRELRYLEGVACVSDGASLRHTHRAGYMQAALAEVGPGVELVVADHGFAGAAIEQGIPTLSIADLNDVALPLAQARGRTDGVLPIDDNLAPRLFVQVTAAMLEW